MDSFAVEGLDVFERLGEGTSGIVHRAVDRASEKVVAVKFSHHWEPNSHESLAFRNEYAVLARFRHENIARAYRFGLDSEGRPFYTMEYVANIGLIALCQSHGLDALALASQQVCAALDYAHAQGILHGDLKPGNILVAVDSNGKLTHVRLTDFGLAQHVNGPRQRVISGTPPYLAPELLHGWGADVRTDLYSLGVTLREAVLRFHLNGHGPDPLDFPKLSDRGVEEFVTGLPGEWAALLNELTRTSRLDRPRSVHEVFDRLTLLLPESQRAASREIRLASREFLPPSRLIGRDKEVAEIVTHIRAETDRRVVLLTGESGSGKSRLFDEVVQKLEMANVRVKRLALHDLLPRSGETPPAHFDPTGRGTSRLAMYRRSFEELLDNSVEEGAPLVLAFDNLEILDVKRLSFLQHVARWLLGTRGFLLATVASGEGQAAIDALEKSPVHLHALSPLSHADTVTFLRNLLEDTSEQDRSALASLDDETFSRLADWLESEARGNPGRILEAMKLLRESQALEKVDERWKLHPGRIPQVLSWPSDAERFQRLTDALSPDDIRGFRQAALLGNRFNSWQWGILLQDPNEVGRLLHLGLQDGLISQSTESNTAFRFTLPSFSARIMEEVSEADRKALHHRAARLLDAAGVAANSPSDVAQHYALAEELPRARELYLDSAFRLRRDGATNEASREFSRVWEIDRQTAPRKVPPYASTWMLSLQEDGQLDESIARAEEVLTFASASPPYDDAWASLQVARARSLELKDQDGPLEMMQQIAQGTIPVTDSRIRARAMLQVARLRQRSTQLEANIDELHRARALALDTNDFETAGICEMELGRSCWRRSDLEKAIHWHTMASEKLLLAETPHLLCKLYGHLGVCHAAVAELPKSVELHRRAGELFRNQGERLEAGRSYQNLAANLVEYGRFEEARKALKIADRIISSIRQPRESAHYFWGSGKLAYASGDFDQAAKFAQRALEAARTTEDSVVIAGALVLGGLIDVERERFAEAIPRLKEAIRLSEDSQYHWGKTQALLLLARTEPPRGSIQEPLLDQGLPWVDTRNAGELRFYYCLLKARCAADRGVESEAKHWLGRGASLHAISNSLLWQAILWETEARVHLTFRRPRAAAPLLGLAVEHYRNLGAEKRRADCIGLQKEVMEQLGNVSGANAARAQERALRRHLGLPSLDDGLSESPPASGSAESIQRALAFASRIHRDLGNVASTREVIAKIVEAATTFLGAERGLIALIDPGTGKLTAKSIHQMDPDSTFDGLEISQSSIDRVLAGEEFVSTDDALKEGCFSAQESIRRLRIRSLAAVPIRQGNTMWGVLYLDHRELVGLFGAEQKHFLSFLAEIAATSLSNAKRLETERSAVRSLREEIEGSKIRVPEGTIAQSPVMLKVLSRIQRVGPQAKSVLLLGPTGAGKDHFAQIVHDFSGRKGAFVPCLITENIPEQFEATMFGVVAGAATQVSARRGLVELARDGTLFINEIGDALPSFQRSLLEFIDRGQYRPIGATDSVRVSNARIVCATNRDLAQMVREGLFRSDLYHRIAQVVIRIPGLEDRQDDLPGLIHLLLSRLGAEFEMNLQITPSAQDVLASRNWPGNIRDLNNCLHHLASETEDGVIDLPLVERVLGIPRNPKRKTIDDWRGRENAAKRETILAALQRSGGILLRASKELGVNERTLRRWIEKFRLQQWATRQHKKDRPRKRKRPPHPPEPATENGERPPLPEE